MTRRMMCLAALASIGCLGCDARNRPEAGGQPPTEIVMVEGMNDLKGTIAIDGSSSVYPVTEAVAEEFQNATRQNVKVTVGISGTGGGFKKFTRGETDISAASRPILKEEMALAREHSIEFIELPVCFDALTVAVNPAADWVDSITIAELKKIWEPEAEGKVTHWNQIRPEWPNEKLVLFGAGTDSGTFDYFTLAINGKEKASRGDYTASEDDNTLVQGIERSKYALGYIPYAYFEPNRARMKALKIIAREATEGFAPSAETVISGQYVPLSRPLFVYVSKKSAARPEVSKFVEFYLKNAPALAREVKYIPLPERAYAMALERLNKLETGSGFGGVPEVGLSIEEILNRTPTH
jgi:phosphate transport system substrate-binding protein